jgi:hypothetical protein
MAFEIKRAAELSLASFLEEALPGFAFYVSKGGTETGGVTFPKPPFGAIWIDDAEKTISYLKVFLLRGSVVWITRAGSPEGDVAAHSDSVQQIYNALLNVGSGTDDAHNLVIHGLDVGTVNEFSDTERLAHGDVISFTMGVTELES